MPLDSQIAQGFKTPEFTSPLQAYGNALAIQNAGNQNALAQYTLSKARREDMQLEDLRMKVAGAGGPQDLPGIADALIKTGKPEYMQMGIGLKQKLMARDALKGMAGGQQGSPMDPNSANPSVMAGAGGTNALGGGAAPSMVDPRVAPLLAMDDPATTEYAKMIQGANLEYNKPRDVRPSGSVYQNGGFVATAPGVNGEVTNWANGVPTRSLMKGVPETKTAESNIPLPGAAQVKIPLSDGSEAVLSQPEYLQYQKTQKLPGRYGSSLPADVNAATQGTLPTTAAGALTQIPANEVAAARAAGINVNGPTAGLTQTTAQKEAAGANEKQLAEEATKIREGANVAVDTNYNLGQMRQALQGFDTGKLTNWKQGMGAALQGIAPSLLPEGGLDSITNYQEFRKYSMKLGFDMARKMGARESTQIVQMAIDSNPNPEMVKPAANALINGLTAQNDYAIAKAKAQDAYMQANGGTLGGFNSAWQSMSDPRAFLVKYQTPQEQAKMFQTMSAADRKALAASITKLRAAGVL